MYTLSDFDFDLPPELIAQRPCQRRTDARLLICQSGAAIRHGTFPDIVTLLRPGDALVLNDTHVLKARMIGRKAQTGGRVELLLSRPQPNGSWIALVSAKRGICAGTHLMFGDTRATVVSPCPDEPGAYRVVFDGDPMQLIEANGQLPLPPYMQREADLQDEERYQTVFAKRAHGLAVAAPTAGLHFDQALLAQIAAMGVSLVYVTLDVGPGTFFPIRESIETHKMHAEPWVLTQPAADTLNHTRRMGGRIVAVGTTSVRVLESAMQQTHGHPFTAAQGLTRLFIKPGFQFLATNALITNFHVPKTTLLLLVAAAIGRDRLFEAYREAIAQRYRFYSYGDACYFDIENCPT